MQRRRFMSCLTQALAALGAAPAIARATPAARLPAHVDTGLHLQDCRIAGSHYYGCHAVLDRLRPGDTLQLRRQPDNPHDPRAIKILRREHKLGYLPRLDNAAAASLIDRSLVLRAEIIGVDDPYEEWEPLQLRLWVTSDERDDAPSVFLRRASTTAHSRKFDRPLVARLDCIRSKVPRGKNSSPAPVLNGMARK